MARTDFDVIVDAEEKLRIWECRLLVHQAKYGDPYTISATLEEIKKIKEILEGE